MLGLRWAPLILVSVWGEGGGVISAPWGHREHLGERLGKLLSVTQAEFPTKSRPGIRAKWAPGTEHQTKLTETKLWFLKTTGFLFWECASVWKSGSHAVKHAASAARWLRKGSGYDVQVMYTCGQRPWTQPSCEKERKQEEMHQAKIPSPAGAHGIPCDRQSPVGSKYPLIKILLLLARASVL